MNFNPIRRHYTLHPLSREHHHSLLLCWKIRTGVRKNIEPERIKKYIHWFYQNYLLPHFEMEEKYIFPILGNDHSLIKKTLKEHERLKRFFELPDGIKNNLSQIEAELNNHIRFEERILFNKIQSIAS